jgi:hypothetical protein
MFGTRIKLMHFKIRFERHDLPPKSGQVLPRLAKLFDDNN